MTVQISFEKIVKILRLHFDGVPQEKIAKIVKVSQSTVAETIIRFEEDVRKYGMKAASEKYGIYDQIEALARLSAELRKNKIVVEEAKDGSKLLAEMSKIGIESSEVKNFLMACKSAKNKEFMRCAIKLTDLQIRNDMSYDEVVTDYQNKALQKKNLGADIENLKAEKAHLNTGIKKLKSSFNKRLTEHNLSIRKLDYILEIIPKEMKKGGLNSQEIQELLRAIRDATGLSEYLKQARRSKIYLDYQINESRNTEKRLYIVIENLYRTRNEYTAEIREKESKLEGLIARIEYANKKLAQMSKAEERKKENIMVSKAILSFLASKDSQAWHIDDIITTLQAAKYSKNIKMEGQSVELIESARIKLARIILPLVENELVSKSILNSKETEIETLKQDIASNYVLRSEVDDVKSELEKIKEHSDKIEESSKSTYKLYEDSINKFTELNNQVSGTITKLKEDTSKIESERDELQRKLAELANSTEQPLLWYKANIKPEELAYENLEKLENIIKDVRQKKLPTKVLSDALDLFAKLYLKNRLER
ncbi:MAG: hypothetical protein HYT72_03375 [Candidatus Aenigmarchaeota archaeon]|nr:hypothetical protein [Candidatus Aenigmarchaeota archaeon]